MIFPHDGVVLLLFLLPASSRPSLSVNQEGRYGVLVTHPRLRWDQKSGLCQLCFSTATPTKPRSTDVLKWRQPFHYPFCQNLANTPTLADDLLDGSFWNTQFASYQKDRDLSITLHNRFQRFSACLRGYGWCATALWCIFEATVWLPKYSHPLCNSAIWWSTVLRDII
jgi:hypothetical protein